MQASGFQYQVRAQPVQFTGDPVVNLDHWEPEYPSIIWTTFFLRSGFSARSFQIAGDPVPDVSSWIGSHPDYLFRIVLPTGAQQVLALDPEPRLLPLVPDQSWQQQAPDWLVYRRPVEFFPWTSVVEPLPAVPVFTSSPDFTADIREQSTGSYVALLVDEVGSLISPFDFSSLTLTLYVVGADGSITYIRRLQDVLNINDVRIYDTPQSRPDGKPYNFKWSITAADTTLVADLPFERHIALFTYQWPTGKVGRHEVVLNVKNLGEV